MIILGIDPGLQHTGWGLIEAKGDALRFIKAGVINTSPKEELPYRLLAIHNGIKAVLSIYKPDSCAIEETYVNKNYSSSLKLAHARSAAILTLGIDGLIVSEYPAKTIKKTLVGSGAADKNQMMLMLNFLMPGINKIKSDASDALAVAVCHSRFVRPTALQNIANF